MIVTTLFLFICVCVCLCVCVYVRQAGRTATPAQSAAWPGYPDASAARDAASYSVAPAFMYSAPGASDPQGGRDVAASGQGWEAYPTGSFGPSALAGDVPTQQASALDPTAPLTSTQQPAMIPGAPGQPPLTYDAQVWPCPYRSLAAVEFWSYCILMYMN